MIAIEEEIRKKAPGALYGEYAKREDCWNNLKANHLLADINSFKELLKDKNATSVDRTIVDIDKAHKQQYLKEISDVGADNWKKIYLWCKVSEDIPLFYTDLAHTIGKKVRDNITFTQKEISAGIHLLNILAEKRGTLEAICSSSE